MDGTQQISTDNCAKVFVFRDFTDGMAVKFESKLPPELEGKIDQKVFEATVSTVNQYYSEAESLGGRTYCESCFSCLTAYLSYICMDTYYEKSIKKATRYIEEQNNTIYVPRGLMLIDPVDRGLRCIEICLLNTPARSL